ncbi:putative polypeptide N-acetylgalactosaminyltransferase 9-like, partial [Tropilaelaps mercedesae]
MLLIRRFSRGAIIWKLCGAAAFSWLLLTLFASTRKDLIQENLVFQPPKQMPQRKLHIKVEMNDPRWINAATDAVLPVGRRRMRQQGRPAETDVNNVNPNRGHGEGVIKLPLDPRAPGEGGVAVIVPNNLTGEAKKRYDNGWQNNAFNQYASDLISLHRSLPDMRHEGCRTEEYRKDLPATAVIICFHNEAWSVLLRTVHSVIDRSPKNLLKEIILVDDFSDMPHLKDQLAKYVSKLNIVRIVRARRREGLIRARILGAKAATASVVTFLDSHCECTDGMYFIYYLTNEP